jgi:hypothetical protein
MLAAAAGCGSSGASHDAALVCGPLASDDCSTFPLQTTATICTLDAGIEFACRPCGSQSCTVSGALVHGARYTYIQIDNADVWFIYAYDQNQKLVAKLFASVNGAVTGQPLTCAATSADFDPSEAKSLLPVSGPAELTDAMCAAPAP